MSGKELKSKANISERGSYVDAGVYCGFDNCLLLLGPVTDCVMRHTATFNIDKQDVEKLLVDIMVVTAKILVKYMLAKYQMAKQ
jgi:hypothetical protein